LTPPIPIPSDVQVWLRDTFQSCNERVSSVVTRVPTTHETSLDMAFIEHFAFQCGYCTAGFLNESQVLLERLTKKPIARADLEKTIAEALDGQDHAVTLTRG